MSSRKDTSLTTGSNRHQHQPNSENMENDSVYSYGSGSSAASLQIGRFRLRLPKRKLLHAASEPFGDRMEEDHEASEANDFFAVFSGTAMRDGRTPLRRTASSASPHPRGRGGVPRELNAYHTFGSPPPTPAPHAHALYRAPDSLAEALGDWRHASEALLRSDELRLFLATTRHVVLSVGDLAIRTALLPVTLPLHVACSTTGFVVGGTCHIVGTAGSYVGSVLWTLAAGPARDQQSQPVEARATTASPTKRLTDGTDDSDRDFLDRLRLDYHGPGDDATSCRKAKTIAMSEFLLRVSDVGLLAKNGKGEALRVHFVDLSSPMDQGAIESALHRLFLTGVSLLSKHPTVKLSRHYPSAYTIDWRAESATAKLLRRMAKMSTLERLLLLQENVLVWSGRFQNETNRNALPAFLARGMVHKSPREFMELLWDNRRTKEYNNYCVSRTDALVLFDKILEGASEGAKVVQSETRVPYTGITVKAKCLMHVRPLEAPDAGFIILSRSCDTGEAGTHWDDAGNGAAVRQTSANEILWGINVFRAVPNHPHLTDLTSLSQVSSSLVPTFMANRIGLMGVEDFFKNVRTNCCPPVPPQQ